MYDLRSKSMLTWSQGNATGGIVRSSGERTGDGIGMEYIGVERWNIVAPEEVLLDGSNQVQRYRSPVPPTNVRAILLRVEEQIEGGKTPSGSPWRGR